MEIQPANKLLEHIPVRPRTASLEMLRSDVKCEEMKLSAIVEPTRVAKIMAYSIIASMLLLASFGSYRTIPGGPFIWFRGEVIPIVLCVTSVILGLCAYRKAALSLRITILVLCGMCLFFVFVVALGIVGFWMNPYSRGDLIRF